MVAQEQVIRTYAEDTTNTTWYMPDTGNHMASAMLPVNGNGITYNSIENINANPQQAHK